MQDHHTDDTSLDRVTAATSRPTFVLAVVVLAVNDHLLKGSGVLPPWLTGKLSDVAGLFFFPVLLTVLAALVLRPECRRRVCLYSKIAVVLTVGGFAALNLSPAFAADVAGVWGIITPDPTDLVCLPAAVAGHVWFRRDLHCSRAEVSPGVGRTAMIGFAALASLATSKNPPDVPEVTIQNEKASPSEFVESRARIIYQGWEGETGVWRRRIDGSERSRIALGPYLFRSTSRTGETILVGRFPSEAPPEFALYREHADDLMNLPSFSGRRRDLLLSPDGTFVAAVVRAESAPTAVHLVEAATGEATTIRSELEGYPRDLAWSDDGGRLYLKMKKDARLRYDLEQGEWAQIDAASIEWSSLYRAHAHREPPTRCRDMELRDPAAQDDWDSFEGLERVHSNGNSEVLVEVKFKKKIDDFENYQSPFNIFFFASDCDYVVYRLAQDEHLRVVDVESKVSGTIGTGRRPYPVPETP